MSSPVPSRAPHAVAEPVRQVSRRAQQSLDRARLAVVPRSRARTPRVPFVALISLVLVTGVVGLLLFNTSMQQASFATTALEKQAATLAAREQALRMDLAARRDPQEVARRAQAMGMVIPDVPAFIELATGKVTGTARPAAPEDRFSIEPAPVRNPYGASDPGRSAGRDRNGPQQSQQSQQSQQPSQQ